MNWDSKRAQYEADRTLDAIDAGGRVAPSDLMFVIDKAYRAKDWAKYTLACATCRAWAMAQKRLADEVKKSDV